ncbi:Leucine zipper transcription factor-like protein 1 [Cryptotermes secundus]|uniref:Leucine zipper transcription factor-like protein 1 n=2 Tax=Cryptotermes secundus TaxID=105785 RepID=A0A2J7QYK8_9NEOP|nr:leucine zipper transcription factor-like protein 1 isoform X1 [Cryptotermes secundus]XP_023707568.1 leucine zipper transcription factor-like protein 1 isoform X2 [Cryptotermes secundus]PNF33667.1 Leucine zipper transcription factor-like protein 1 [Cryptotermes secundus]
MSELGLNEHHQMIIMSYMKFARYQRIQNLKAIEYAFKDVSESRLLDDTYTGDEVQELLLGLCKVVRADIETELISSTHMTVLLLKQLFEQAEKWHLRLQADLSELENREQLEVIKTLESNEFSYVKPEKNPPTPTKIKLVPMNESSGSVPLLRMEIERLKDENEKLAQAVMEAETKANLYLQEADKLKMELGSAQNEISTLKELSSDAPESSHLDEVENQLSNVRNLLATNLELSASNQQQLELELSSTREKVAEVQSQLSLAEQELERKFSQTAAYANMKKILNKKNEQIKELRGRLQHYEPNENNDE